MKFERNHATGQQLHVAPLAGAWIEIPTLALQSARPVVAPLAGAWIEIKITCCVIYACHVAPLAGAWIEIYTAVP